MANTTAATPVDWHYARPELAESYLTSVTQGIMNRMTLLGVRRVGKTEFLLRDFCPAALKAGYLPIYMNLWAEPEAPQRTILHTLSSLVGNGLSKGNIQQALQAEVKKLEVGNNLLGKIGVEFDDRSRAARPSDSAELLSIGDYLRELVKAPNLHPLLILDEVQHLASNDTFLPVQAALRTAFDTHGRDLPVVYAGSSRSGIHAMFSDSTKPFYNSAYLTDFPVLGREFAEHCCGIIRERFNLHYNPTEVYDIFRQRFDDSPFWLAKLIQHLLIHQCSVTEASDAVREQMILDGGFEELRRTLNKTDKVVLILIQERAGKLFSDATLGLIQQRFGLTLTAGKVDGALKKLLRHQLISKTGRSDYLIENARLVDYLREEDGL